MIGESKQTNRLLDSNTVLSVLICYSTGILFPYAAVFFVSNGAASSLIVRDFKKYV